jgi:hypothetical protein
VGIMSQFPELLTRVHRLALQGLGSNIHFDAACPGVQLPKGNGLHVSRHATATEVRQKSFRKTKSRPRDGPFLSMCFCFRRSLPLCNLRHSWNPDSL